MRWQMIRRCRGTLRGVLRAILWHRQHAEDPSWLSLAQRARALSSYLRSGRGQEREMVEQLQPYWRWSARR
jgi:hypothetical protein